MPGYGVGGWGYDFDFGAAGVGPADYDVDVYPVTIMNDGGWEIRIANQTSFPLTRYRVHLGPNADATDPVCYPGVPGAGEIAEVEDGRFITVWSPPLPIGGPYSLFFEFEALDGTGVQSGAPVIEVVAHVYRSKMMSMRRLFPANYKTEYRLAKRDDYPQT